MFRINYFQLYTMMVVLTAPIAFLETPKHLNYILLNNAWLAAFAGLIPGILLAAMFKAIIEKSRSPFPLMLEEHLGVVPGKLLGFIYILFFLLVAGYSLRHFIDFIITNVLPATPISVLTGIMLLLGVAAIKGGLEGFSRVNEVIVSIGLPFTLIIIFSHMGQHHNIENLLPFADMSLKSFGLALFYSLYALGKLMAVLSLAFFCPDKKHLGTCLYSVVITFIMVTGLTTLATNLGFGGIYNVFQTFPVFSLVRSIKIGEFIQNIDIVFIGIWIMGIFASATIPWFMACYTTQQVFKLQDYRFIAAPSTLVIGITAILLSRNILEEEIMGLIIIPVLYTCFFIAIPLVIFIITLFKPSPQTQTTGLSRSNTA